MVAQGKPQWLVWGLSGLALAAVIAVAYAYRQAAPYGQVGTAYLAKQYCSCLYVAGRGERQCRAEFKPDIDRFQLTAEPAPAAAPPASAQVTARLLIWSAKARYTRGFGCSLVK